MEKLESDLAALAHRLDGARSSLTIEIAANASDTEFGRRLAEWAERFASAAGLDLQTFDNSLKPRSIRFSSDTDRGVSYAAIPEGPEAGPLREAMALLSGLESSSKAPWVEQLEMLDEAVQVLVFVTPSCPHCPNQVREAMALALASPKVKLMVVDAEAHPELAVAHGARSVPFTVLDGELGLVGAVPADTLVKHLVSRGSADRDQSVLNSLVQNGRMADAASKLERTEFRVAFAELWKTSVLSSRMGLMMLAQEALEVRQNLFDDIVANLLPLLESEDDGLRGDTVDLLGAIAHPDAADGLEKLKGDPDEDIVEAAEEALEAIAERNVAPRV